jgi:TonB dependent receptor-like, beta-barrel/Carboxypeptidase regulatory-like domain
MKTFSRLVGAAAVVVVLGGSTPAFAVGEEGERGKGPVDGAQGKSSSRQAPGGSIVSVVRDKSGRPIPSAIVSAIGRRIITGVTDSDGRCTFTALPPGDYLVRVHRPGFISASSLLVLGGPGVSTTWSFVLKPQPAVFIEEESPRTPNGVLAAGMIVGDGTALQPPTPSATEDDHDHGETAWRLRHLKRSVLKDSTDVIIGDDDSEFDDEVAATFARRDGGAASLAASLLSAFPLAGQVNLLTTSSFDSPQQLISAGNLARGAALVSLGAAAGQHGDWSVQGAMTQGDVTSWMVSGSYLTRAPARHVYDLGMSYSLQRYDGSNPAALAAVADGNRFAGLIYAFDSWTITQKVSLLYGGRYAKYGYVEQSLFSPRARFTITPTGSLRLSVGASRRALAPGAEEFVPSMIAGTWLPPERTFAPISGATFTPQRTTHFDATVEHDFTPTTLVGVRAFHQRTGNQLVTLFGLGDVERPAADLGHYFVGTGGDVLARGWSVSIRQVIARRVRGSVDYTVTTSQWQASPQSEIAAVRLPGVVREGRERVQDVTASIDTDIPVTETHVFALYRLSDGFAGSTIDSLGPSFGARFDVQVTQSLPFMDFASAHWEMLVGVRNLFREMADEASIYDELLVVRPPKRIVGGLTLRF